MLTGTEFETNLSWVLYRVGFWTHKISCDERGAQPFDVIAIKGRQVLAIDCKVCGQPRFPISRAELNQKLSFMLLSERTEATCGFACYYDGNVYFIPYSAVENADGASVKLSEKFLWMDKARFSYLLEDGAHDGR